MIMKNNNSNQQATIIIEVALILSLFLSWSFLLWSLALYPFYNFITYFYLGNTFLFFLFCIFAFVYSTYYVLVFRYLFSVYFSNLFNNPEEGRASLPKWVDLMYLSPLSNKHLLIHHQTCILLDNGHSFFIIPSLHVETTLRSYQKGSSPSPKRVHHQYQPLGTPHLRDISLLTHLITHPFTQSVQRCLQHKQVVYSWLPDFCIICDSIL